MIGRGCAERACGRNASAGSTTIWRAPGPTRTRVHARVATRSRPIWTTSSSHTCRWSRRASRAPTSSSTAPMPMARAASASAPALATPEPLAERRRRARALPRYPSQSRLSRASAAQLRRCSFMRRLSCRLINVRTGTCMCRVLVRVCTSTRTLQLASVFRICTSCQKAKTARLEERPSFNARVRLSRPFTCKRLAATDERPGVQPYMSTRPYEFREV